MEFSLEMITDLFDKVAHTFKRLQFGGKAQLIFLEDLYLLINDGIPANRAIEMLAQVTTGLNKEVALSLAQKISEGKPLADGMREWFSLNIVEIIRVGEEGGALAETIRSAIKTLGERSGSIGAIVAAVTYPLLVIFMACCIIIYLDNSVFIQFRAIKPIDQWPQAGRDLVNLAALIQNWWLIILALVVALVLTLRWVLNNYTGALRVMLDRIPPFSLARRFAAARLMETMGLLIANGVVFKNAIRVMQYQATPYMLSHLITMEYLLSTGRGNVADVLSTGLIDEKDILRLRVMAEVKGFEHGLIRMGIRGMEQSNQTLKLIAKLIGAILMIVGGILIVVIVRGIYLTGMSMGGG